MVNASDYLEDKLAEHIVGKTAYTMPAQVYLALSTTDPGESGSGITEPVGMGYARILVPGTSWGTSSGGEIKNSVQIEFAVATDDWGTLTHYALFDHITAGDMLVYGELSPHKIITEGDIPLIDVDNLSVTVG